MGETTTHEDKPSRVCSLAVETASLCWTRPPPRCGGVRRTEPKLPADSLGSSMTSAAGLLRLPLTPLLGFTPPPGTVQRRSTTSVGGARLGYASSGAAHRSYGAALAANSAFLPVPPPCRNARILFRRPRQRISSYSRRPVRQHRYLGMEHSDRAAASPSPEQRPAENHTTTPLREQLPRRQRTTVLSALARPSVYRDGLVLLLLVVLAYALASTTTNAIMQRYDPSKVTISSDPKVLPVYGFQSVMRLVVAYGISLVFSMIYAYIAYRASFAAQMLLLIIDVLQSVPILAFVPAAVLGLIAMFPGQRLGVELAAILLLFTSMAWNMLLGFYQSLISIPPDLMEAARVLRLSAWRRFWLLEAPAGVCSLVWNSIISVSSGWFFLISIESFSLGPGREYRLPGLGSFLSEAADRGNMGAVSAGLLTVVGLIVCIDFLLWRPLIVWSERFKFSFNANASVGAISALRKEVSRNGTSSSSKLGADVSSSTTESSSAKRSTSASRRFGVLQLLQRQNEMEPARNATGLGTNHGIDDDAATLAEQGVIQQRELDSPRSIVFAYFQRSPLMRTLRQRFCSPLWQKFLDADRLWERTTRRTSGTLVLAWKRMNQPRFVLRLWNLVVHLVTICGVLLISGAAFVSFRVANHALRILRAISLQSWMMILGCAMFTFARVLIALVLSLLWTVPLGVAIGCSPALARVLQPLVQIAASVPATAVFPFLLLGLANLGGFGLQVGSILLMMLGTMWYILFNVIAGSAAIPTEFWEADAVYNKASSPWPIRQWKRWRYLILPGIFPYLITGIVTAVGGAWNASIVSEYVQFRGKILSTRGLGALISDAAARGDMPMLLASTLVMAGLVLLTNRFVWAPLYKLARERYTLN